MYSPNKFMTAMVAATAVGAAAGLFLAPKPGRVLRRFLAMKANKIRTQAESQAGSLRRSHG
jgi:gas vesicle protein